MTKTYTKWCQSLIACMLLGLAGFIPWQSANAERLFTENFNYTPGNLYGQGGWWMYASNSESPIQVSSLPLEYEGYPSDGGKVTLGQTSTGQDLFHQVTDATKTNPRFAAGSTAYVSFLLNVKDIGTKTSRAYFFALCPETSTSSAADKKSPVEYVKLYTLPSETTTGKFNLAFSGNGAYSKATYNRSADLDLNTTYLVVLSVKFVDGNTNDEIKMWINPVISPNEPAANVTRDLINDATSDMSLSSGGFKFIELRQGQTSSNDAPLLDIDGIHVADSWADLFDTGSTTTKPVISSTMATYRFGMAAVGSPFTFTSIIGGQNLKGDITFSLPSDITASPSVVTKEQAAEGVEVTFTVTPTEENSDYDHIITLTSEDAQYFEINVVGEVVNVHKFATATAAKEAAKDPMMEYEVLMYTGKAVVTAITTESSSYSTDTVIYLQDSTGGMKLGSLVSDLSESGLHVGDEITNFTFMYVDPSANAPVMYPMSLREGEAFYSLTAQAQTVTPLEVNPSDITSATAPTYLYRLVQVKGAQFESPEGKKYTTTNMKFSKNGSNAVAQAFPNSGLVGEDLPAGLVDLTGISRSHAQLTLCLRDANDVTDATPQPTISTSVATHRFGMAFVGEPFTFTSTISGENLKNDITFALPSDITASPEKVTKEQAAEGVEVTFTVTPTAENNNYDHVITLMSMDAPYKEINVVGQVMTITKVPNAAQVYELGQDLSNEEMVMMYTGKAVVTAMTTEAGPYLDETVAYLQDMTGGMKLGSMLIDLTETGLQVGDEITNLTFMFIDLNTKAPVMYPVTWEGRPYFERLATGKTKTPVEINLADVTATTAPSYLYKLVTVKDVHFVDAEGKKYTTTNMKFSNGDNEAVAQAMSNSGLVGEELPTGTVSLTGISASHAQLTLRLRNADDVAQGAASMTVTPETLFTGVAVPVGETTPVMKFTVVANNLPAAAPLLFGGADADKFTLNMTSIPAGSGTHEVIVSAEPAAPGKYSVNFMIDADAINSEFNYSRKVEIKAYDPENLPAITIEPATLNLFAKPGETVTAKVTLKSSGCFDYITGAAEVKTGVLLINNTFLPASTEETELVVTFKPTVEGNYNEVWTYTSTMCDTPATLTVTALCAGERPEEDKQGDPFAVSDENPLVTYSQAFSSVESNKPLKLEGWTNVAVKGTRAWWGYRSADEADPFTAAKVTAFDSTVLPEDATEVEMLLISPALNYKDAADRNLEFRLMGMYLTEDQLSKLDVMLGIPNGTDKPDFYVMNGFNIPATSDEAGEWIPYVVDMSVVPDMPDTFFIAFRFTSERSKAEAATYYITDFKWNPTGAAVDFVATDGLYEVYNLQGMRLLKGADATAVKALPRGLYIINGRKTMLR